MHLAAGKRLLVPAIEVGGEHTRTHVSDRGHGRPIDRKVEGADFRLPEVLIVSRCLNDVPVRKSGDCFTHAAATIRALEQQVVGRRGRDVVGQVHLKVVDACGKALGPRRGVDQAGSEGVPRLRLELWVATIDHRESLTVLYVRATRHAVGRTVRPLRGRWIVSTRIEGKLLEIDLLLEELIV